MTAIESNIVKWLTVEDVAERLQMSPRQVRRWAESGVLPSYVVGHRAGRRFTEEHLRAFEETIARQSATRREQKAELDGAAVTTRRRARKEGQP